MAKEPQNDQIISILQVYKDGGEDTWAQSYGFKTYEIPAWVVEKHGKLTHSSTPDILQIFESQIVNWVKNQFGL